MKDNNCKYVANTYNQLISYFMQLKDQEGYEFLTIAHEFEGPKYSGMDFKEDTLAITEKLHKQIIKKMKKIETDRLQILNKKENRLFFVVLKTMNKNDSKCFLLGIFENEFIIKV